MSPEIKTIGKTEDTECSDMDKDECIPELERLLLKCNIEEEEDDDEAIEPDENVYGEPAGYSCIKPYRGRLVKYRYRIDEHGLLTVSVTPNEGPLYVPESQRMTAASYVNEKNSEILYGTLDLGIDGEGYNCYFQTPYIKGMGTGIIKYAERVIAKMFLDNLYDIEMICKGMSFSPDGCVDTTVEEELYRVISSKLDKIIEDNKKNREEL